MIIINNKNTLRTGITTGSCAAAASKAATIMLLSENSVEAVIIEARDRKLDIEIEKITKNAGSVFAVVRKFAGDDPDATDGIEIISTVRKTDSGISVTGGFGVGKVTKAGLKVDVGKSAINPVPMQMIIAEVSKAIDEFGYTGGIEVVISVPRGVEVAKRTLNSRLGVIGGISILGTTGVVQPMSEKALIDSIKVEIDFTIANSNGLNLLTITPGNYGYDYAKDILGIDVNEAVKCSNYIGETLDYALYKGVKKIVFIGHAGKLVKIAGGIMNTHSNIGDCRMEIIAAHCGMFGMDSENIKKIMECVTVNTAIEIIRQCDLEEKVWSSIGNKIKFYLNHRVNNEIEIEFYVFTQEDGLLVKG